MAAGGARVGVTGQAWHVFGRAWLQDIGDGGHTAGRRRAGEAGLDDQTMPLPITGWSALSVAEARANRQNLPGCRQVQASGGPVLQNRRWELPLRGRRRFIQRPRG